MFYHKHNRYALIANSLRVHQCMAKMVGQIAKQSCSIATKSAWKARLFRCVGGRIVMSSEEDTGVVLGDQPLQGAVHLARKLQRSSDTVSSPRSTTIHRRRTYCSILQTVHHIDRHMLGHLRATTVVDERCVELLSIDFGHQLLQHAFTDEQTKRACGKGHGCASAPRVEDVVAVLKPMPCGWKPIVPSDLLECTATRPTTVHRKAESLVDYFTCNPCPTVSADQNGFRDSANLPSCRFIWAWTLFER